MTARPALTVRWLRMLAALVMALVLLACGGGDTAVGPAGGVGSGGTGLAGGVGSGGSGLAEGRVSGFGSLIVDGQAYDDDGAQVVQEDSTGERIPATVAVGQQVRLTLSGPTSLSHVEVLPQLLGPVTAAAAGGFVQVLHQWVRVDATTVLVDHASAAVMAPGEELEVHGHWVPDAVRGYVLAATRIARRSAAADAPVLVSGVVRSVTGLVIELDTTDRTQVTVPSLPAGLAVSSPVSAWVARVSIGSSSPLPALRLRGSAPQPADGDTLRLSGPVWESVDGRISVQGVAVLWPASQSVARPAVGDFVLLSLKRRAGAWEIDASASTAPQVSTTGVAGLPGGEKVQLSGTLSSVAWTAQPLELTLRDTRVRVPADVLGASTCAAQGGAVSVQIEAAPGPLPLVATRLACTPVESTTTTTPQTPTTGSGQTSSGSTSSGSTTGGSTGSGSTSGGSTGSESTSTGSTSGGTTSGGTTSGGSPPPQTSADPPSDPASAPGSDTSSGSGTGTLPSSEGTEPPAVPPPGATTTTTPL
jgi:hypothetical protein